MQSSAPVEVGTIPTEPSITPQEISRAATNDPALSDDEFILGGRKFKVVDLPYDDYIKFISLMQPLLESLVNGVSEKAGLKLPEIVIPTSGFTVAGLVKACVGALPEMACIVCSQTDPTITVDEVKTLAKTPFKLAQVVLKQIVRNNIIKDFSDFFEQVIPFLKVTEPTA